MCIVNDRSQGAEDRGGKLLSIRLKAKAEDKIDERGRGGDDIIEDGERVEETLYPKKNATKNRCINQLPWMKRRQFFIGVLFDGKGWQAVASVQRRVKVKERRGQEISWRNGPSPSPTGSRRGDRIKIEGPLPSIRPKKKRVGREGDEAAVVE